MAAPIRRPAADSVFSSIASRFLFFLRALRVLGGSMTPSHSPGPQFMIGLRRSLVLAALVGVSGSAGAQDAEPAGNRDPVLRLEGGGPLSPITAVAFGTDGATLYETGWDKVVR